MLFISKLTPEQWAEARRLRASGELYRGIARRFGLTAAAISKRARKEGWPPPVGGRSPARRANTGRAADVRRRLALSLLGVIDLRISMLERRMERRLQAQTNGQDAGTATLSLSKGADEGDTIAALIDSINQVMALSETAPPVLVRD